jgi:hypothetical protein
MFHTGHQPNMFFMLKVTPLPAMNFHLSHGYNELRFNHCAREPKVKAQ